MNKNDGTNGSFRCLSSYILFHFVQTQENSYSSISCKYCEDVLAASLLASSQSYFGSDGYYRNLMC